MKMRLSCLLLCLTVLFGVAGCTQTPPADTSQTVNSDPAAEATPDDFFTENGQGFLPEKAALPALCKETSTQHLYSLELALPAGKAEEFAFSFCDTNIHAEYTEGNSRYHSVLSNTDGSLLSKQKIPYHGSSGMLADGGYWIIDRNGLVVTFYTPDGTATQKLASNNSYRGSMMPNFAMVSSNGKTVVAGFETGTPFVMIDLETKEKTRVNSKSGSSEEWTFFGETQGLLLFSGNKGSVLELNVAEKTYRQLEGHLRFDEYLNGLYRVADLSSGLLVKGLSAGENALMLLSFANAEEVVLASGLGLCITVQNSRMFVYDLRTSCLMSEFSLGRTHSDFSAYITDDGYAYITAKKNVGAVCYVYDLVSACQGEGEDVGLRSEIYMTDSLDDLIEACAEEVSAKHGIEIICGSEGNDFPMEDYLAKAETDPGTVFNALQEVDRILSLYPAGMIEEAIGTYRGLQLYLCGSIYGLDSASLDRAGGFTTDYGSYIVVVMNIYNGIQSTLPHELSHVFDRHISSKSTMYFDWLEVWEEVTPCDDAYLYTYAGYQSATDYTVGHESNYKNIWFTDGYGRTFPTEDRARVMECMFDSETGYMKDLLKYDNLAYKARLYSFILRQCFESCQVEEELYWERFTGIPDASEFQTLLPKNAA